MSWQENKAIPRQFKDKYVQIVPLPARDSSAHALVNAADDGKDSLDEQTDVERTSMLLQWCNLKPLGPSNLAAIRFSSPCRVQAVKIFPTGAKPFANCPDIIAWVSAKTHCTDADRRCVDVPNRIRSSSTFTSTRTLCQVHKMGNPSSRHPTRSSRP